MNRIELATGGFPVTTETFEFLQQSFTESITALTALGGESFILKGIQRVGSNITDGAIVYKGEYLPFIGGEFNNTVSIIEEARAVQYNTDDDNDGNLDFKNSYFTRYAQCGNHSDETFSFEELKTLQPLTMQSTPIGGIIMWSGEISDIPLGWKLCNGENGTPNLTDRFIVGAGNTYIPSTTGGTNNVTLNESQMPSHNHNGRTFGGGSHSHSGTTAGGGSHSHSYEDAYFIESIASPNDVLPAFSSEIAGSNLRGASALDADNKYIWQRRRRTSTIINHSHSLRIDSASSHTHPFTTNTEGENQPHENRPPFYALAFIMYIGS